jgi:hypothetical protein
MTVQWYRIKSTYDKPQGGFLAIGPRYPGVISDDGVVVLFTIRATHSGRRWFPSSISRRQRRRRSRVAVGSS